MSGSALGPPALAALLAGTPYRVLKRLGSGGISSVYLVEHEMLLKCFALKVLHTFHAQSRELIDRARVEAQAIARLRHPHVVEVIDFWFGPDDTPCIVLELLQGHTLAHEIARGPLPPRRAVDIARQTLSALQAAHELGIVHRDIKPENLFLQTPPAGTPAARAGDANVKVLDFGLARILPNVSAKAPSPLAVPTGAGIIVGTLRFMSPEAARGERVGPSADIFSLGVVLYAMLAGRVPFTPELALLDPPSSRTDLTEFPGLEAAVWRAMAKLPSDRFQSAAEFRKELKRYTARASFA